MISKNQDRDKKAKGLLNWIIECNTCHQTEFIDFVIEGIIVGGFHKSRLELLKKYPEIFEVFPKYVSLHSRLNTPEIRTKAVETLLQKWRDEKIIQGWRDEHYRVSATFQAPLLMSIERSAAPFFGIVNYGVHVNGITSKSGQTHMWLGRRSPQKSRFPGYLDHLVAGGHSVGMSAWEVLIKECQEEAGISKELAKQAKPAGAISFCMNEEQTLKRDVLFMYDLPLPEHFMPKNTDGEVSEFLLWPIEHVMETIATTRAIKTNCNLVMIDFLVRHGYLTPEDPHYLEIVHGLRTLQEQA